MSNLRQHDVAISDGEDRQEQHEHRGRIGKLLGLPPKAAGGKPKPKLPSRKVREAFARAEYQQKLADGLSLVDDYGCYYAEYRRVAEFGGASGEIAAMEKVLGATGRILIRPSGTEPVIRVMIEGDDEALITQMASELCDHIMKQSGA